MSAIIALCANIARNPDRVDVDERDSDDLLALVVAARNEYDGLVAACRLALAHLDDEDCRSAPHNAAVDALAKALAKAGVRRCAWTGATTPARSGGLPVVTTRR